MILPIITYLIYSFRYIYIYICIEISTNDIIHGTTIKTRTELFKLEFYIEVYQEA